MVTRKQAAVHRAYVRPRTAPKHEGDIKTYEESFLMCRGEAHSWLLIGYYRLPDGIIGRLMLCDRCETLRRDKWRKSNGERLNSSYVYAPGYQIAREHHVDKSDVRREVMRRVDIWANEEQLMNGRG